MPIIFKNIKSLTARCGSNSSTRGFDKQPFLKLYTPQFISSFKNLTSLNLERYEVRFDLNVFLDALAKTTKRQLVKLILPPLWRDEHIQLDKTLANRIINSNIVPPQQMPKLQTFHASKSYINDYNLNGTNITKLVCSHNILGHLYFSGDIPSTTKTIKFREFYTRDLEKIGGLKIQTLVIQSLKQITDTMINWLANNGYRYRGAIFKKPLTRQFTFTKLKTKKVPQITIEQPKTKLDSKGNLVYLVSSE
ncbi:hypothetical protein DFA_06338 [Cavenderia fasciculata]|uniref:Uncharacterized protein n=1 Tax=Cavenderia fasciculata TaxID=261658 RepID=F4PKR7_CACFS|nr:uncharacterized protein DFA_06338 [Cavenderia fasciculata]EGG24191.1 hypothetical protein DFA_06338 [Cavenderia fasciculata]|eukprot:XP_004362042.1 hypothetical protein DFA_06338 [Cavenderia fasciculata]